MPTSPAVPGLIDQVLAAIRVRHLSRRTEKAYLAWIRRFVLFKGRRHPAECGAPEATRFLTFIAVEKNVSASTQNQALAALLFLYRDVLERDLPWLDALVRAKRPERLPVVLTLDEVAALLDQLDGAPKLMASLLYGAGLRLLECARLRVNDVDLERLQLVVRQGKGGKDRITVLPTSLRDDLARHLASVRAQHERNLAAGAGWVELPDSLATKLPNAGTVVASLARTPR